jgi:hypothetical protein
MPEGSGQLDRPEEDALYLGILTARHVKPLSRLEYPVRPAVGEFYAWLGLLVRDVNRTALNGRTIRHWVLSRDAGIIRDYQAEFDGTVLETANSRIIRAEARYFGYPPCCAIAYIRDRFAPNGLPPADQALLFHRACPNCQATPALVPLYRRAMDDARRSHRLLVEC